MRAEQSSTISSASRWLKALKSRPTRVSAASAIAAEAEAADEWRRHCAFGRAGDREYRHVVIQPVGGKGAQRAFQALHRPGWVAGTDELSPQALLAKAPLFAFGLDDAIGGHHQLLPRLDLTLADPPLALRESAEHLVARGCFAHLLTVDEERWQVAGDGHPHRLPRVVAERQRGDAAKRGVATGKQGPVERCKSDLGVVGQCGGGAQGVAGERGERGSTGAPA